MAGQTDFRVEVRYRNFDRALSEIMEKRVKRAVHVIRNSVLEKLVGERHGRWYYIPGTKRKYQASAPGEPPALRLGDLRKSVKVEVEVTDDAIIGRVGTDLDYGRILEEKMNRAWLVPAFDDVREDVRRILGGRST